MSLTNQKRTDTGRVFVVFLTSLLVLISTAVISAASISVEYTFGAPEVRQVTIEGETYHRIIMADAPNGGEVNCPALPARGAQMLIPYSEEVIGVDVIAGEKIFLGAGFYIEPVMHPFPISAGPDERSLPHPDEEIYALQTGYPGKTGIPVGTYSFRGYNILIHKLIPMEYIPASGELYYYSDLTIVVHTENAERTSPTFRGLPEDYSEVCRRVDNPDMAATYDAATKRGGKSFDLLIITSDALAPNFQPLKDYHDSTGIPTEIHTLTQIGSTSPDNIRDYIRDRYLNDGIEYVLIGGDNYVVQSKGMYVQTDESEDAFIEFFMPVDLYYSCLDGTFDYDGDGLCGEPNDGEGGGDVDLLAEVYIGRICAGAGIEVDRVIAKTVQYLNTQDPFLGKVLLCGENLSIAGFGEYGGYSLDELVDGSDMHGYTTLGIPGSVYEIDRLYDLTYPGNNWPAAQAIGRINSSQHIVNHYGHCNADWAMKMTSNTALTGFTNSDHFFLYSQGCNAGWFDGGADCWAEKVHHETDYGAFAVIMNARFGFGARSTDGPSHRYNREFWDAVFNPEEDIPELGRTNQDSKEDNLYRINEMCMRWCYYELTLFGDPTTALKTRPGLVFNYPVGLPETVAPEQNAALEVSIACACGASTVPGSGQLHYSVNGQPLVTVSMTEGESNHYTTELPAITCGDALEYYVSVEEVTAGRLYDPDPGTPLTITVCDSVVVIYEDDFETDRGWIAEGQWARGIPTGSGGEDQQYGGEDPTSGCNGPNVYGYNLDGDYANSLPETHLTSIPVDCSEYENVQLDFMRWLGVQGPSYDHASIRISADGDNWTTVWENSSVICDNTWVPMTIDISEAAAFEPTVYLRWTMGNTNYSTPFCGWNIDDVRVIASKCTPLYICGDANGDANVDVADAVYMINYVFNSGAAPEPLEAGDANGDGQPNVADAVYLINYVFNSGPAPLCP